MLSPAFAPSILLYDTTLRDGTQREGISLSVADKIKIAHELDRAGIAYVEAGWPGSNPKDAEVFRQLAERPLGQARLAAFGSTRRVGTRAETDTNLRALIDAGTPVITLVGKSSAAHVEQILETTRQENLAMIGDSVAWCAAHGREVIYDAEHWFDGFQRDPEYALATIRAAAGAGAAWLVLCDTNGGTLPEAVASSVRAVRAVLPDVRLGIHAHNDCGLGVANALAAVAAGCTQVQGTVNGYGERCGNADLLVIAATLQLKLGHSCVPNDALARFSALSAFVADVAGLAPDRHAPYVGQNAFAHKGGLHAAAVAKVPESYQHIDPGVVGNAPHTVVSELSGRASVRLCAAALGLPLDGADAGVLQRVKELEARGYQFESAAGSFEMLLRRAHPGYEPPFIPIDFTIVTEQRSGGALRAQAIVKLRIEGAVTHTAAEGAGPVNALDRALRTALLPRYPELAQVQLVDYRVRIVDEHLGTAARPRVLIESARGSGRSADRWRTVGCSEDIIEASWLALVDSLELPLARSKDPRA